QHSQRRTLRVSLTSLSGDRGRTAAAAEGPWSRSVSRGSHNLVLPEFREPIRRKRRERSIVNFDDRGNAPATESPLLGWRAYRRRKQRGCWLSSAKAPQPHTWVSGTASHLPRLEDLDGLDIRFLAPAANAPFGQCKASPPFGAAVGRHALGPELAGRV